MEFNQERLYLNRKGNRPFTIEELRLFFRTFNITSKKKCNRKYRQERDRLLFLVIFYLGLRKSTALTCHISHFDFDERVFRVFADKNAGKYRTMANGANRTVPIPDELFKYLNKYLIDYKDRIIKNHFYLFDIDIARVGEIFNKHRKESGLDTYYGLMKDGKKLYHLNIHSLRSSYATYLLDQGVDIFTIQKLLGHNTIISTMPYIKFSNMQTQKKVSLAFNGYCIEQKPKRLRLINSYAGIRKRINGKRVYVWDKMAA